MIINSAISPIFAKSVCFRAKHNSCLTGENPSEENQRQIYTSKMEKIESENGNPLKSIKYSLENIDSINRMAKDKPDSLDLIHLASRYSSISANYMKLDPAHIDNALLYSQKAIDVYIKINNNYELAAKNFISPHPAAPPEYYTYAQGRQELDIARIFGEKCNLVKETEFNNKAVSSLCRTIDIVDRKPEPRDNLLLALCHSHVSQLLQKPQTADYVGALKHANIEHDLLLIINANFDEAAKNSKLKNAATQCKYQIMAQAMCERRIGNLLKNQEKYKDAIPSFREAMATYEKFTDGEKIDEFIQKCAGNIKHCYTRLAKIDPKNKDRYIEKIRKLEKQYLRVICK